MVNVASERLSEGTIPAADGYGLVTAEVCDERKKAAERRAQNWRQAEAEGKVG
jgi:hypothetical protein